MTAGPRPRGASIRPVRVTWPQPVERLVVSRAVPSARPVTFAPTPPACAKARLAPLNPASKARTFHLTIFSARGSGPIGPGGRAPGRGWPPAGRCPGTLAGHCSPPAAAAPHRCPARRPSARRASGPARRGAAPVGWRRRGPAPARPGPRRPAGRGSSRPAAPRRPAAPPVAQGLTLQAPRAARVIGPSHLPPPPFCQVLGDRVGRLSHGPPPAMEGSSAIEERAPQRNAFAYVGISGKVFILCNPAIPNLPLNELSISVVGSVINILSCSALPLFKRAPWLGYSKG